MGVGVSLLRQFPNVTCDMLWIMFEPYYIILHYQSYLGLFFFGFMGFSRVYHELPDL